EYTVGDRILAASAGSLQLTIPADQRVGGAVVLKLWFGRALELWNDPLGKCLAQFHTPLIKRIDLPDRALCEHDVFVKRDQFAQGRRRQSLQHEGVRRAVSLKQPMRHEPVGCPFGLDLISGLAERQRLRLGEHVGEQHIVMPVQGIKGLSKRDEIAGYESRSLMDQLIERMLAIGPRLTPINRPGFVIHRNAVDRYVLAIALHGELLEIGWKALEVLLIRQHSDGLSAEEVVVPDAKQAHQNRQVVLEWRRAEMLVHLMEAAEHGVEIVRADSHHGREPDGRIHRIAAADPIPEA